jgi:hypothetical protein
LLSQRASPGRPYLIHLDGFNGEVLYLGSELSSYDGLAQLRGVGVPLVYVISWELFSNRDQMLHPLKRRLNLDLLCSTLELCRDMGVPATITYISGLEPLSEMKSGFRQISSLLTRFPVINIFQAHGPKQQAIQTPEAADITYLVETRKWIEAEFGNSCMRPRSWENYRGLWYSEFAGEVLEDIRV